MALIALILRDYLVAMMIARSKSLPVANWITRILSLGYVVLGAFVGRGSYLIGGSLVASRLGPDAFSLVGLGLTGASFVEPLLVSATATTIVRSVSMARAADPGRTEWIIRIARIFFVVAVILMLLIGGIIYAMDISTWFSQQQPLFLFIVLSLGIAQALNSQLMSILTGYEDYGAIFVQQSCQGGCVLAGFLVSMMLTSTPIQVLAVLFVFTSMSAL